MNKLTLDQWLSIQHDKLSRFENYYKQKIEEDKELYSSQMEEPEWDEQFISCLNCQLI